MLTLQNRVFVVGKLTQNNEKKIIKICTLCFNLLIESKRIFLAIIENYN
jgi:hypothetical protein